MSKKKKVNPRRIPLSKNSFDEKALLNDAMKDNMTHAWLLVAEQLHEAGYDITALSEAVFEYMKKGISSEDMSYDLKRAYATLGFQFVSLDISRVKSPVELEAYKRKLDRVVLDNSLSIVYLGLEKDVKQDDLKKIFFNADLTRAELEHGLTSYDELKNNLVNRDYTLDVIENIEQN